MPGYQSDSKPKVRLAGSRLMKRMFSGRVGGISAVSLVWLSYVRYIEAKRIRREELRGIEGLESLGLKCSRGSNNGQRIVPGAR